MGTLSRSLHPVNIACGVCLCCTTLAPLPTEAFTFDVLVGSVIVEHQSAGTPLVWAETPIGIRLELGQAGRTLLNDTTSWDENAATALTEWDAVTPLLMQQSTATNVIRWAHSETGEHLEDLVAKTVKQYATRNGRFVMTQATILLNPDHCWDAYDGPLRYGFCHDRLEVLNDIRRIVLHELGHVLGLEHPDDGGQQVNAIMNHQVSDTDALTADDEAGVHFLYPPHTETTVPAIGTAAAGTHASGGGGGCSLGNGQSADLLLPAVLLLALCGLLQRAVGRR